MSASIAALLASYAISGGGGTATAPSVSQINGTANNTATRTTTTLSSVAAGDLIIVWASVYAGSSAALSPGIQDSTTGSFANTSVTSNTYTVVGTALDVQPDPGTAGNNLTGNAWHTVASGSAATLTIGVTNGEYRAIIAVNMGQVHDAGLWDDGGTRKTYRDYSDATPNVIDNATTTYTHDYVLGGFFWFESTSSATATNGFTTLLAVGDNDNNRLAVIGRSVTTTGNYDPTITLSSASWLAGLGYTVKGVAV